MNIEDINFNDIISNCHSLPELIHTFDVIYKLDGPENHISSSLDELFITELEQLTRQPNISVQIDGRHNVRAKLCDDADREHSAVVARKGVGYSIIETSVPHGPYQTESYPSLASAFDAFRAAVDSMQEYFDELQRIDCTCWVLDPPNPTFKDDYRKIVLEDRVWLHVEVPPDGGGARLRVVGASSAAERWKELLATRLTLWDPDASVVDNIRSILEIESFLQPSEASQPVTQAERACGICLCVDLAGAPQPLCAACDSYLHPACLARWLTATSGGVVPKLGVLSGKCPCCLSPISVSVNNV